MLGGGWVGYGVAGYPAIGAAFADLTGLHYAVGRARVHSLLSR